MLYQDSLCPIQRHDLLTKILGSPYPFNPPEIITVSITGCWNASALLNFLLSYVIHKRDDLVFSESELSKSLKISRSDVRSARRKLMANYEIISIDYLGYEEEHKRSLIYRYKYNPENYHKWAIEKYLEEIN